MVVSCACVQSVALLLMSKSRLYPSGLANSSGELGKNFIPHFTGGVELFLHDLIGKPAVNDEGFLDHAYIPSFMHRRKRDYGRSFGMQFNYQNRRSVGWARSVPGFGKAYKESVKARYPAYVVLSPYGEMLPNRLSYIDLDETKQDAYGLPVARRTVAYTANDKKLFTDMTKWARDIAEAAGAEILYVSPEPRTNHELGGARMGSDPRRSVVDRFCRTHDIPNLYVVDGSVFPSASEKNPDAHHDGSGGAHGGAPCGSAEERESYEYRGREPARSAQDHRRNWRHVRIPIQRERTIWAAGARYPAAARASTCGPSGASAFGEGRGEARILLRSRLRDHQPLG